jgi:hypothetical protein
MEWQIVAALVLAIPVILLPVAFVWYLNLGGLFSRIKELRAKKAALEKGIKVGAEVESGK